MVRKFGKRVDEYRTEDHDTLKPDQSGELRLSLLFIIKSVITDHACC